MHGDHDVLKTILSLIKAKGLTQKECLTKCNINTSFLSDWKKGKLCSPSYDKLVRLADYFEVSLDYLLTGKRLTQNQLQLLNAFDQISKNQQNQTLRQLQELADAKKIESLALSPLEKARNPKLSLFKK